MGFSEMLAVLLSLSGFGVADNPNAPSAAEVQKYAPAGADYMMYLDVEAIVPGNWKVLAGLPGLPAVKGQPKLQAAVKDIVAAAEKGRAQVKAMTGIDPITDVRSLAAWVEYTDKGDPSVLIVVRGKFAAGLVDRAGTLMGGNTEQVDGRSVVIGPDGKMALATTADGSLVGGTPAWVKERAKTAWKPLAPAKGSAMGRATALFADRPLAVLASSPSPRAAKRFAQDLRGEEGAAILDLLTSHPFAGFALHHAGVTWTATLKTAAGYERWKTGSEGVIDLLRASHFATRGFAKVGLTALEAFGAGKVGKPEVAALVKYKKELLALVDETTGDGKFEAKLEGGAADRTVTVKAVGKKLSDVVPAGGLLPLAGAGAFFAFSRGGESSAPHPAAVSPAPRPARPVPVKKTK